MMIRLRGEPFRQVWSRFRDRANSSENKKMMSKNPAKKMMVLITLSWKHMVGKTPPAATAGKENKAAGWCSGHLCCQCFLSAPDLSFIQDEGCDDNNHHAQENERMSAELVPHPGPHLVTGVATLLPH